eukprot:GDKI01031343.1.p1 GENE.GDKI01031343.1~~GDKI01031343.1.p1  ORF type:complete len:287 (-),score=128.40 GDKI01031343.1:585-1445(-)
MRFTWTFCLLALLAVFVAAEDSTPAPKKEKSLAEEVIEKAIGSLTDAAGKIDIEKLKQLRDLIRTQSTSEIKEKWQGKGFIELDIKMQAEVAEDVPKPLLMKQLSADKVLSFGGGVLTPDDKYGVKAMLTAAIERTREFVEYDASFKTQGFQLQFKNSHGGYSVVFMGVQRKKEDGLWTWRFAHSSGSFVPEPDYMVLQRSKSSFFSSSSWVEIVPLPTALKVEHVDMLLATAMPRIAKLFHMLSFDPNDNDDGGDAKLSLPAPPTQQLLRGSTGDRAAAAEVIVA